MTMTTSARSAARRSDHVAAPPVRLHPVDSPGRAAVEDFIRRVYGRRYGAAVASFAPALVALHDADGSVIAAAGYRGADGGPLFLEQYLPAPVDRMLAARCGPTAARERIVEIGHLCADRPGAGRVLMAWLAVHLAAQGFEWVVCTLTRELRHLVGRMGVAPLALGAADPAALGGDARAWGSYYDHDPVVLAGQIRPVLVRLVREARS